MSKHNLSKMKQTHKGVIKKTKRKLKSNEKTAVVVLIASLLLGSFVLFRLGYKVLSLIAAVTAIITIFYYVPAVHSSLFMMLSVLVGTLAQIFESLNFYINK